MLPEVEITIHGKLAAELPLIRSVRREDLK